MAYALPASHMGKIKNFVDCTEGGTYKNDQGFDFF